MKVTSSSEIGRLPTHPRVKPEHKAYRTVNGDVRLGGGLYGIAVEIKDPTGVVWTLLESLDGSRTVDEAVAAVRSHDPGIAPSDIVAGIEKLFQAGHLEDADTLTPESLSAREIERYDRGHAFYRWVDRIPRGGSWDVQLKLRDARVVVVGVGGAGGAAAQALAATGVGHLHCVDSDVVELSNLNRQVLYDEDDIGRPKVEAAVARLTRLNSDIEVTGERFAVRDQDDLARLIDGFDVLVLGADRPGDIRSWANRACLAAGVPWVDGGYHGALLTLAAYTPGDGPCWECLRIAELRRPEMSVFNPDDKLFLGPRVPGHPVTAVSAMVTGCLMAHAAIALITGAPALPTGSGYGVNLVVPDDRLMVRHPRQPECPACGHLP
jgi:molybdopterin/thiamine biosynthesis adenylyltransferase